MFGSVVDSGETDINKILIPALTELRIRFYTSDTFLYFSDVFIAYLSQALFSP